MNSMPMCDSEFAYVARNGSVITSTRCDFRDPVYVTCDYRTPWEAIMVDIAEMSGYHATVILPELPSFQGYDTLKFIIKWSE